jgi:uncharacterized membrane protein
LANGKSQLFQFLIFIIFQFLNSFEMLKFLNKKERVLVVHPLGLSLTATALIITFLSLPGPQMNSGRLADYGGTNQNVENHLLKERKGP